MKLEKCESLKVADQILKEINKIGVSQKVSDNCWVDTYANGREVGYHIGGLFLGVSFSQSKNSDNIVVYCGKGVLTFDVNGVPTTETCKNGKLFQYNKFKEAAKFIVDFLEERIKEIRYEKVP
jgi:hypothetical protein